MSVTNTMIRLVRQYREKRRSERIFNELYAFPHETLTTHPQPPLTESEKAEIDKYWAQYGIHYKDYSWFQWYYGYTGIKDPRFVGKDVQYLALMRYYNNQEFIKAYKDKNYFERFLPSELFPKAVLRRIGGKFYDASWHYISDSDHEILLCSAPVSIGKTNEKTG